MEIAIELLWTGVKYLGSGILVLCYHKLVVSKLKGAASAFVAKVQAVKAIALEDKNKVLTEIDTELNALTSKL